MARDHFLIAQFSDIHCGGERTDDGLLDTVIAEIDDAKPDLVLVPGDLTDKGYPDQYDAAKTHLARFDCCVYVVPGNHDARNVGHRIFEDVIGERNWVHDVDMHAGAGETPRLRVVGCDSTRPDLNDGELGRHRQEYVATNFAECPDTFKILMIHHHIVPIPGTGRERNILLDAGDVLQVAYDSGVDIILAGHKHVPHVWPIAGMLAVTSGTACTWRTRAYTPPSFNWIRIYGEHIEVVIQRSVGGTGELWTAPRRKR